MKAIRRCAESPNQPEFSLCGDAFDAFSSGDSDEPFEFAGEGQTVNCEMCVSAIREIKKLRNPLRPRSEWLKSRHLEMAGANNRVPAQ